MHVFRQSQAGTLLVDRFVFDAATGRLSRTIEVRFKRSGKRHTPLRGTTARELDSRDFRGSNGDFFLEPSTELRHGLGPGLDFDDFRGDTAVGDWRVCAGDSGDDDPIIVDLTRLTINRVKFDPTP